MSIASVANSNPISGFSVNSSANASKINQLRQQFQQLGEDLQAGNLTGAQADFGTLQQEASPTGVSSTTPGNNPVAQALKQLQTDLQTGNLAGAPLKPAGGAPVEPQGPQTQGGHAHHHHHGGEDPEDPTAPGSGPTLDQMGQALQTGNVSAAQQAYNSVLEGLPLSVSTGLLSTPDLMSQSAGSVSLNA